MRRRTINFTFDPKSEQDLLACIEAGDWWAVFHLMNAGAEPTFDALATAIRHDRPTILGTMLAYRTTIQNTPPVHMGLLAFAAKLRRAECLEKLREVENER